MPAPRRDLAPDGPSVTVVVPAMNEARNLPWLAKHMPKGIAEIILVDGHSVDDTVAVARGLWPDVRIVSQNRRGKGNALACGFHAATSEIIVMIDADGSMDPGEIPFFVDALVAGADYAKGSRFGTGGGSSDITPVRAAGNRFLNRLTNTLHRTSYSDLCYGYNAFWRRVLPLLAMDPGTAEDDVTERKWGDGFEVETLINIRVHNSGLRIAEVASFESERLFGSSNLHAVSDGLRVLRTIAIEKRDLRRGDRVRALSQQLMRLEDVSERSKVDAVTRTTPAAEPDRTIDLRRSTVDLTAETVNGHSRGGRSASNGSIAV
ncbi:glycosyltransferase family 2 protein [Motilibacter peucedani]